MNCIRQQLGCGKIMFNALQGLCVPAAPLFAWALLLLQKATVYCISFNPLVDLLFLIMGAVCVVFKMVLQPNTCKLRIQCLALAQKPCPQAWTSAGSSCFTVT